MASVSSLASSRSNDNLCDSHILLHEALTLWLTKELPTNAPRVLPPKSIQLQELCSFEGNIRGASEAWRWRGSTPILGSNLMFPANSSAIVAHDFCNQLALASFILPVTTTGCDSLPTGQETLSVNAFRRGKVPYPKASGVTSGHFLDNWIVRLNDPTSACPPVRLQASRITDRLVMDHAQPGYLYWIQWNTGYLAALFPPLLLFRYRCVRSILVGCLSDGAISHQVWDSTFW